MKRQERETSKLNSRIYGQAREWAFGTAKEREYSGQPDWGTRSKDARDTRRAQSTHGDDEERERDGSEPVRQVIPE
jgi:hypothetical protein